MSASHYYKKTAVIRTAVLQTLEIYDLKII